RPQLPTPGDVQVLQTSGTWPNGFDVLPSGASATILALGDVQLHNDGRVHIQPTPHFLTSGEPGENTWRYETWLSKVERGANTRSFDKADAHRIEDGELTYQYENGVEVFYNHLPAGLEQNVRLLERIPGNDTLRVSFDVAGNMQLRAAEDGARVDVYYNDAIAMSWTNLVVFD